MSIKTLKLTYIDPSTGKLAYGFNSNGLHVAKVQDVDSIIQKIVIKLFTATGSNANNPESGNQFFRKIGGNYSSKDQALLSTNLQLAFEDVINQVIVEQDLTLPPNLLVAGFEIISIIYDKLNGGWEAIISIKFENGASNLLTV